MYPTDAYPEQLLATAKDRIRELERARERKHRRRTRRQARRAALFTWLRFRARTAVGGTGGRAPRRP